MITEINTIFRTALKNSLIEYRGVVMPILFQGEYGEDAGAHLRGLLYTNEPTYPEVGSYHGEIIENITGYYQVGIFLPISDKGLDYSINEISDQVRANFKRQGFFDSIKMEYLSVNRETQTRTDGHEVLTCRVNFRATQCSSV